MDISKSPFYTASPSSYMSFKDFLYSYTTEVLESDTNSYFMDRIIDGYKKLGVDSRYKSSSNSGLVAEDGAIYFEKDDPIFELLSDYFNSTAKRKQNVLKNGIIQLHECGFLDNYIDVLKIDDHLTTLDGVPLMECVKKDIKEIDDELGEALQGLYTKYPVLIEKKISIRDIYLTERLDKVYTRLFNSLDEEKATEIYGEVSTVRNKFLDKTKKHRRGRDFIEKYNVMSYDTYTKQSEKFRADLRSLIPNDKFYLLDSQYASICGVN